MYLQISIKKSTGASKEEVKRIMDDASVQIDAAASITSQGNRVEGA
jgi:hypothetical protein